MRVILDVTSLVRWVGPPVGIVRVVHALAMVLRDRSPELLVAYDPARGHYRHLAPQWMDTLLGWSGLIDRHVRQAFPRRLASRAGAVMALERIRLTTRLAPLADRLQRLILMPRPHQFPLEDKDGRRIANVPADLAHGTPFRFEPTDTLLLPGMGWSYLDPASLRVLKAVSGCRIATICYDLIPITHPHFYSRADQAAFEAYWRGMVPVLDHWLLSARAIQADLLRWCAAMQAPAAQSTIVDFGYDSPSPRQGVLLPKDLRPGRFALFVSTLEPRKGHAVLLNAWEQLLDRGVLPHDFQLVFVGRAGWMVDDVLRRLALPIRGVLHLPGCSDAMLDTLYRDAAFCCYPSQYEGYGLPLIEAFARGKAVLSSSGGALPETAGPFAPCLDPLDADAWADAMADWIRHPDLVAAQEAAIVAGFRHPDWAAAAADIIAAADGQALNRAWPPGL